MHRHGHVVGFVHDYAVRVFRPHRGQHLRDDVFYSGVRVRVTELGFARWHDGRKSNAGAPNVDGVPIAERFFLGVHFSAGNHAVDFLCARRAFPYDIFHRAHARDYPARRKFFRILA